MHTCLSLSNLDCHSFVEGELSDLAERLGAFCHSIDSCHISVEQPIGESGERYWRVTLNLRIFDASVRARTCQPIGSEAAQSLARVLDEIHARAMDQMTTVARRHHCCCCAGPDHSVAAHRKECA
jgi:hypothetical protein